MTDGEQSNNQPADEPLPVLPYSPGHDEVTPPAQEVYGQMGRLALVLSLVAASYAVAHVVLASGIGPWRLGFGTACCFGLLPWLLSITIAVRVSMDSAGRNWAGAALLIDLLLMVLVFYGPRWQ